MNYDKGGRLGEIKTPTLMIAGAADALLAANLADSRASATPRFTSSAG